MQTPYGLVAFCLGKRQGVNNQIVRAAAFYGRRQRYAIAPARDAGCLFQDRRMPFYRKGAKVAKAK
jgi:hypothetical protein